MEYKIPTIYILSHILLGFLTLHIPLLWILILIYQVFQDIIRLIRANDAGNTLPDSALSTQVRNKIHGI